jgi:hypothetical protein
MPKIDEQVPFSVARELIEKLSPVKDDLEGASPVDLLAIKITLREVRLILKVIAKGDAAVVDGKEVAILKSRLGYFSDTYSDVKGGKE